MTQNETQTQTPHEVLSPAQQQRAAALRVAKGVLSRADGFAKSGPVDAIDLVSIATYVMTGEYPWSAGVQAASA